MSRLLIDRVVALVEEGGVSRAGLARAAGLHPNTLRTLGQPDWNPTAETLAKLESCLARDPGTAMASPEAIINEAANGRMFILVDDEDRENEGDLVIPAQMATPEAINFMAKFGRGLICLALTQERADALGLEPMRRRGRSHHETAFTVSIEARDGVTTGISAADRARTITVAIDPTRGPADIVTPGHIFPLVARRGGVLIRAGHTEAAVDIARLAGLNPAGVICEIMNEDGGMARLPELIEFANRHGLKIGTIRDLIAYRRQHDRLVERRAETRFVSRLGGDWTAIAFYNRATESEQAALVKGAIDPDRPTLVRMHVLDPFADLFEDGAHESRLSRAMEIIGAQGAGVIVLLSRPTPDFMSRAIRLRGGGSPPPGEELRDYGAGAQILTELGVHDMVLLTNSHHSLVGLDAYGLSIVGERPFEED